MLSFNRETAHFFIFWDGFSETWPPEIDGFTCFWGKNLKPVVVSLKLEILAPQITREMPIFDWPSFTEYRAKK